VGATLELIAAWQPLTASFGWRYVSDTAEENEQFAAQGLAAVIDEIFPAGRPSHCKLIAEDSHPANALIAASKGATCVVVGSRGHGGLAGGFHRARRMVMTANVRPPRIVVGIDGSDSSVQALRWAAGIATAAGARVEAVGAWSFPAGYGWATVPVEWHPADDIATVLAGSFKTVFGTTEPDNAVALTREGGAARVLLEQSAGAALLVVGSRGHGGFAGLLLGSVSAAVAEHATCPVLVVHGDQLLFP